MRMGSDEQLTWRLGEDGLEIERPNTDKPCDLAYVYRIERKDPF